MGNMYNIEVKPVKAIGEGLSAHLKYQPHYYRTIRFPGSAVASARPAAIDTRFGNSPMVEPPLAKIQFGHRNASLTVRPFNDLGVPTMLLARLEAAMGHHPFPSGLHLTG